MQATFTVEEIRTYLQSQGSFGDAVYNLSAPAIIQANMPIYKDFIRKMRRIKKV